MLSQGGFLFHSLQISGNIYVCQNALPGLVVLAQWPQAIKFACKAGSPNSLSKVCEKYAGQIAGCKLKFNRIYLPLGAQFDFHSFWGCGE